MKTHRTNHSDRFAAHFGVESGETFVLCDRKNSDFRCGHCRNFVCAAPQLSGVYHRNHCPYCLHSRHMDWQNAGDRMAACKSDMRPVGLALKHRGKKYAAARQGELMVIHRCVECGKVSINRIAADDDNERLLEIFHEAQRLEAAARAELAGQGISLLGPEDAPVVLKRLYGSTERNANHREWARMDGE